METLIDRMMRAVKLDAHLYEEVEADEEAFGQAMGVVLLASVAAGVGTAIEGGLIGLVIGAIGALITWFIWAYLTYWVGTKLLPEPQTHANAGQLLRTIGFSSSPGVIRVVGLVPGITQLVFLIAGIWMLVAMVIAVRQALDYTSTWRAVGVVGIGWVIQALLLALLLALLPSGTGGVG